MNYLTPELPVRDVAAALAALERLGFQPAWTYEDTFACIYGGANIEIFLRKADAPGPVTLYLKVDDADQVYGTWEEHAEIVGPIATTPWGMREFTARIQDGHLFRVGHGDQSEGDRRTMPSD